MLDTGFDCREVLHLVMCRRVRSPILYQQMRGRGTRTAPHINKQKFVIYDFLEIMNTLTILILIFLPEREQVIYRAAIASR